MNTPAPETPTHNPLDSMPLGLFVFTLLYGGLAVIEVGLLIRAVMQYRIMAACMDVVVPYVHDRSQFGQPIGAFQLIQAKIADMYVALQSARAYTYAVAKSCDAGQTTRFDAAEYLTEPADHAALLADAFETGGQH